MEDKVQEVQPETTSSPETMTREIPDEPEPEVRSVTLPSELLARLNMDGPRDPHEDEQLFRIPTVPHRRQLLNKKDGHGHGPPLFQTGDIVQDKIKPLFKRIMPHIKGKYCDYCFKKSENLKLCTSCSLAYYCDRTCQVKDWKKIHKIECGSKVFREVTTSESEITEPEKFLRIGGSSLFTIYAFTKLNPEVLDIKKKLWDGKFLTFRELIDKYKNFQIHTNPDFLKDKEIRYLAEKLKAEDKAVSYKYIRQLYYTMAINTFVIHGYYDEQIGYSLNLEITPLENSCAPTALYYEETSGGHITIRALGPIYDKPTVRFDPFSLDKDTEGRKQALLERYGIDCHCELCDSEEYFDYPLLLAYLDKYKCLSGVHSIQIWPELWVIHGELRKMLTYLLQPLDGKIAELLWLTSLYAIKTQIRSYIVDKLLQECKGYISALYGPNHRYVSDFNLRVAHYETVNLMATLELIGNDTDGDDRDTDTGTEEMSESFVEEIKDDLVESTKENTQGSTSIETSKE